MNFLKNVSGGIFVRIYPENGGPFEDVHLGSEESSREELKYALQSMLAEKQISFKKRYETQLINCMMRAK